MSSTINPIQGSWGSPSYRIRQEKGNKSIHTGREAEGKLSSVGRWHNCVENQK